MADLFPFASLGSAKQTLNNTAPYGIPGDNFLYAYGSNGNLVHVVVVMQRSNSDLIFPGNASVTHSSGTAPVQVINIPTKNRFKFDAFVFVSTNGAQGSFTVTPTANSIAGGAFFLYVQRARSNNPIRTWSSAYTQATTGTDNGPYASTTSSIPDEGILGLETTPAAGNRNLAIAVNGGGSTFTEGDDHTSIIQIGDANFRAIAEYSEVQSLVAPSVTTGAQSFTPMVSFEFANDASADDFYYAPRPFSAFNADETIRDTDSTIAVADSFNIYRNGVYIGSSTTPNFSEPLPGEGQSFTYTVTAVDAAGNESLAGDPVTINVDNIDLGSEDISQLDDMYVIIPEFITTAPEQPKVTDTITLDTRRFAIYAEGDEASVFDYLVAMIPMTLEFEGPVDITDTDLILTDPSGAYIKNFVDPDVVGVYELFRIGVTITVGTEYAMTHDLLTPPTAEFVGPKTVEIQKISETFRVYDRSRGDSTTDEWWSINNESLNRTSWNITTIGGSRLGVPAMRGEDIQMSMRPGRIWVPKIPDSRVITLIMWVTATDPVTGNPPPWDQLIQWNDNWNFLRRLFYTPKKQLTLTRRWKLNRSSPRIDKAEAKVQLGGTMDPTMTGRTRAEFTVDLVMPDPYFYGPEIPETITPTTNINAPFINRILNPGDATADFSHMTVTFYGPLTNPMLVNKSGANGDIWFRLATASPIGPINAGEHVLFDIEKFKATKSDGSVVTVAVTHSGSTPWFALEPGFNDVVLQADSGTGYAVIRYHPAYL